MATASQSKRNRWSPILAHGWGVALVAVFSYATARYLFHLQESYWAPIAAVVVLYPNAKATRQLRWTAFWAP